MDDLVRWAGEVVASLDEDGRPTGIGRWPAPVIGDPEGAITATAALRSGDRDLVAVAIARRGRRAPRRL